MKSGLSKYKFKKIAKESLINALRLHEDSILLFNHSSFPSAFQMSVLALEEFAKAKWVDHYYYTSVTNDGFPDADFEQEWLKLLYYHPEKQFAFIGKELFEYSPKFVKFIKKRKLELKKQQSVYVGLERVKGTIDTDSRVSIPAKKIKEKDAKQLISLVNHEFIEVYRLIQLQGDYWGVNELDKVIDEDKYEILSNWTHKTGLKSRKWYKAHCINSED
ncbi:MAG: AbiV family abortive infection protein [Sulfuricurvum sp.]|jgi:AbiV family abortive infection protein